eukprot:TRINITY_DN73895_c0_g1_i1.p1 TRINITY_DN73895_c0_g1~~TRINITY_DN73895_c0_g1_i1.p1  ORF type:complete len:1226 (+),score=209.90 TRINITY_DN73895_c0_g1_i1:283-3960(+)
MVRPELVFLFGEHWRRGLRQLDPEGLVRGALVLARAAEKPAQASHLDAVAWEEARKQRIETILQRVPGAAAAVTAGRRRADTTWQQRADLDLTPRDWAGLLWAAAQCRVAVSDTLREGAAAALTDAGAIGAGLQPSDAARCFWAAARLLWCDASFLDSAVAVAGNRLPEASPQDLSNIAWAVATLRYSSLGWHEKVVRLFAQHEAFRAPQAVANVLWSIAKVDSKAELSTTLGSRNDLLLDLAPAVQESLPVATAQNVANMLWACARLTARPDAPPVTIAYRRMTELLSDASAQHIANAVWACARLDVSDRLLFCAVAAHLHERVRTLAGGWQRRWGECSMQHVSTLCWSFAKVMPEHKATRQALRDAAHRVEELTPQGGVKAQEVANLIWAFSEVADSLAASEGSRVPSGDGKDASRPFASVISRVVCALCGTTARKQSRAGEPIVNELEVHGIADHVGTVTAASSLSKVYARLGTKARNAAKRWMTNSSQQVSVAGMGGTKIVALLRAVSTCRVLTPKLFRLSLRELLGGSSGCDSSAGGGDEQPSLLPPVARLRPAELAGLFEAAASLQGPIPRPEVLALANAVLPMLSDFLPHEIACILWPLSRLEAIGEQLAPVFVAGTAALAKHELQQPLVRWELHYAQASAAIDLSETPRKHKATPLSAREWVWALNAAAPLRLVLHARTSTVSVEAAVGCVGAPPWLLDSLVRPWIAWLSRLLGDISKEAGALVAPRRSPGARESDLYRYRAVVGRGGLEGLGSKWTPVALRLLGVQHMSRAAAASMAAAKRDSERLRPGIHARVCARLRGSPKFAPASTEAPTADFPWPPGELGDGEYFLVDHSAFSGDVVGATTDDKEKGGTEDTLDDGVARRDDFSSKSLLEALDGGREGLSRRVELRVLQALAAEAGAGPWSGGDVLLYSDRDPSIACLGALAQLRCLWPGVSFRVAFGHALEEVGADWTPSAVDAHCKDEWEWQELPAMSVLSPPPSEHAPAELERAVEQFLQTQIPDGIGQSGQRTTNHSVADAQGVVDAAPKGAALTSVTTSATVPIALVGASYRVRELWPRVSATPNAKGSIKNPGKKKEWHDKLKHFLRHRPAAFEVTEEGGHAAVRLRPGKDSLPADKDVDAIAAMAAFIDVAERGIAELLCAGKGRCDDTGREGFIAIEELGSRPEVSSAFKRCRGDSTDRLAYVLRHSDAFEVWTPAERHADEDRRSRVRVRPPV